MKTEDIIKQAVDATAAKMADVATKTVNDSLDGFGMKVDKKEQIAKYFTEDNTKSGSTEVMKLKDELPKGHAFARMTKLAWQYANNNPEKLQRETFIAEKAKEMYGKDKVFNKMIGAMTGTKNFQNVTNPEDGGYLVEEMYGELVDLLRARVFLYNVGARVTPMPNGNINLPVHTAGALSYFIGESKPIFPKKQGFGNIKMTSKKQVSMVIISDELMMDNSYQADQRLLDDILREMEVTMNYVALYGSGTEYTPKGIKTYASVTKTSLGALPDGDTAADLKGDILATNVEGKNLAYVMNGAMWAPFYNTTDGNGAYINRASMDQGKLVGSKFHLFNEIPLDGTVNKKSDLFFGDWSEFEIGEQKMFQVDTSKEATIEDASGNKINLFQQGMTAIKVTSFYDFAVRHPEAFKIYTNVYTK